MMSLYIIQYVEYWNMVQVLTFWGFKGLQESDGMFQRFLLKSVIININDKTREE